MISMPIRVATIQFRPEFGKKRENLQRIVPLVAEAASNEAKIVVLPELFAVGYSFMSKAAADGLAELIQPGAGEQGLTFQMMRSLATELGILIAFGLIEKDPGTGDLYNSQALIAPDGKWVSYRKVNGFGQDFIWSTAGRGNPPVMEVQVSDTQGQMRTKKLGLLICRDVRDKKDDAWDSFYEKGDADIVCFSAAWGKGGYPANAWMDFAKENACTLIVSNRYGTELNNDFGDGGICIISKDGKVQCDGLIWGQDCIVYGEV